VHAFNQVKSLWDYTHSVGFTSDGCITISLDVMRNDPIYVNNMVGEPKTVLVSRLVL